jgi:hypothetical protein
MSTLKEYLFGLSPLIIGSVSGKPAPLDLHASIFKVDSRGQENLIMRGSRKASAVTKTRLAIGFPVTNFQALQPPEYYKLALSVTEASNMEFVTDDTRFKTGLLSFIHFLESKSVSPSTSTSPIGSYYPEGTAPVTP